MIEMVAVRADIDIRKDVLGVFTKFAPLAHDRHRVEVEVIDGVVRASGNVRVTQAVEVFEREVSEIPGVVGIQTEQLVDDTTLRLVVGSLLPIGVGVVVSYGVLVLNGDAPSEKDLKALVKKLEKLDGVRKIVTSFS